MTRRAALWLFLLGACTEAGPGDGVGGTQAGDEDDGDPAGSEDDGQSSTPGDASSTTEAGSTTADAEDSGSASSDGTADSSATAGTGAMPPDVPGGVFLWVGAGGGGPGTDLYPEEVHDLLAAEGVDVELGETLPVDFEDRFGTLVYLNPTLDFDATIDDAALDLVERGGRLVLVMEHCKNGCWGNAPGHNALLAALGSGLTLHGDGGAPLRDTTLDLDAVAPLTDAVEQLVVYYSGHVEVGTGVALGTIPGGDVVVGYERIGWGEVLAIADSSMLGYRLSAGDNAQFVANFALH